MAGVHPAMSLTISSSESVTVSAQVEAVPDPDASGGGSGGSGSRPVLPKTSVRFSGQAYPYASIYLLEESIQRASVSADSAGYFSITLAETAKDIALYALFAVDQKGNRSSLFNYPLAVEAGYLTHLSGIRFPPTVFIDTSAVREGGYLSITGYSLPNEMLEVVVTGKEAKTFTLRSSPLGLYRATLPLLGLPAGEYMVSARYVGDGAATFAQLIILGSTVPLSAPFSNMPGDCNRDRVVGMADFSLMTFWRGKESPPSCLDMNKDGKVDLTDFSILAFWWTE